MPKLVSCVGMISYWNSRSCHPREGGDLAATSGDFLCVISILTPARGVTGRVILAINKGRVISIPTPAKGVTSVSPT